MPIFVTRTKHNPDGTVASKQRHAERHGQVVAIRKYRARRNVSDTLDYSDWQEIEVTEALVYVGRTGKRYDYELQRDVEEALPVEKRFEWLDCTNSFVWRGADYLEPMVDTILHPDVLIDHVDYVVATEEIAREQAAAHARAVEQEKKVKAEIERNRPVVGKRMIVASGRKVKPGMVGTVAFVSDSGRVLLKDDDKWQDRKADGVWVQARHLRAR